MARQLDSLFHRPPPSAVAHPITDLITQVLEPMIQRELLHRSFIGERRRFDAKHIAFVEVV
jgi:hypothetical protein